MNKQEFLSKLRKGLLGLPPKEKKEHLSFYSEMIDDRIEDGLSEEAAVSEIGHIEDIIAQIKATAPKKKKSAGTIVLLILGFPVWGSLLIAAAAVVIALYAAWWVILIALWAVFGALLGCAFGGMVGGMMNDAINTAQAPAEQPQQAAGFCENCGAKYRRTNNHMKYCPDCRSEVRRRKKRQYEADRRAKKRV